MLAAPDRYTPIQASDEAVEKLLAVARQDFDYVVVDAGSNLGSACKALFEAAATVYLVTQVSISELRNSNRLISEFFTLQRPQARDRAQPLYSPLPGHRRRKHHQGADHAGQLEDSQRLSRGPARAEHGHSARAGGFAHLPGDPADGQNGVRFVRTPDKKKRFSLFG